MGEMILKMSALTGVYIILTYLLWRELRDREMTADLKIAVGFLYGLCSVFSTHFGVDYVHMLINVRDMGPLAAGLFFDPVSGIIAGLIGGIERYIAGTFWGVGSYTTIACSVSTCLAGFVAAFMHIFIFKRRKPSAIYAFFMGAVMEVFHMYAVFITHRDDMSMAFNVVRICSIPMILFTGIGLAVIAGIIRKNTGELRNPLRPLPIEETPVSHRFQVWLFGVAMLVLIVNFVFSFMIQTNAAKQTARNTLNIVTEDIAQTYYSIRRNSGGNETEDYVDLKIHVGKTGSFVIFDSSGSILASSDSDKASESGLFETAESQIGKKYFTAKIAGEESLCKSTELIGGSVMLVEIPEEEIYATRDSQAYETILADILVFAAIYVLISMLVQKIVVDNLQLVNESLRKITDGDLDEEVRVYGSSEFASLSDDINHTVFVLKSYIDAAEKRFEQELLLAKTIQDSSLPRKFDFNHKGFEVYAAMDPAREVGGDFYDVFFVDTDKLALVMADVSGKGIPAALFMMRCKTALRGYAETGRTTEEICRRVGNELCAGNELSMFVTVWIAIVDLANGNVCYVNAGHEYPAIKRRDGNYKIFKDKHFPALGAMEDIQYREYEMHLDPGDCLFVYTDGVPEALNRAGEQYGLSRMISALNDCADRSMHDLLQSIREDVSRFAGNAEQFDDLTMMGFRYLGPEVDE